MGVLRNCLALKWNALGEEDEKDNGDGPKTRKKPGSFADPNFTSFTSCCYPIRTIVTSLFAYQNPDLAFEFKSHLAPTVTLRMYPPNQDCSCKPN